MSAKTGHSKSQLLNKINLPTDGPGVKLLEERVKEELLALGLIDSPTVSKGLPITVPSTSKDIQSLKSENTTGFLLGAVFPSKSHTDSTLD